MWKLCKNYVRDVKKFVPLYHLISFTTEIVSTHISVSSIEAAVFYAADYSIAGRTNLVVLEKNIDQHLLYA